MVGSYGPTFLTFISFFRWNKNSMLTLKSPAKVNLFLRILHKRTDGYHELASLFQAIDLCDTLKIQLDDSDHLTCSNPDLPTDRSNLILKAVDLFRKKTGVSIGLNVHLDKKIPMQAGLGGGSSNAATTLWAFNKLVGSPASESQLAQWASEIGSDISFFFSQGTAYCSGRGEKLRPLDPLPQMKITIAKPAEGLSTPEVYSRLKVDHLQKRDPELILRSFFEGKPEYFNDLEGPAFEAMPKLILLKQSLMSSGYDTVLLCGSGSSFFCFGNGSIMQNSDLSVFSTNFIQKKENGWY